ncbi:MAG: beta-galactosidase, partial [Bacteroidales bacterium]|nr:beta-galactosidase [Bacteroidales bacterium]
KGYITPDEFRSFCGETVPLARMEKRVYKNSEVFQAEIEMAHFGELPLSDVTIKCLIANATGEVLHQVKIQKDKVPVDNAISVGSVVFDLGQLTEAGKLTLTASVEDTPFSNSWDFWVYPDEVVPDPGKVHITDKLDGTTREILSNGGSVLLLTHGQIGEGSGGNVEIGFSSIFWNTAWTGGQAPHTLGILCDPDHPVFNAFPTEYHSNWQWWDPVTHSQAMILDHLPGELRPLIQPIDTWFENRRLGLAFEAMIGNGKIMVCSIEMQKRLDKRPASIQLLYSMLQYMNSPDFNPQTGIEAEQIQELLTKS